MHTENEEGSSNNYIFIVCNLCSLSKARTVTRRAKVESSPPESPKTTFVQPMAASRVARPEL